MSRRWIPLLAVLILATATGCGGGSGGDQGSPGGGSPEPTGGPASVDVGTPRTTGGGPLAPTTAPSRFAFVDYLVSGGVAGVTESFKVFPDGRAIYTIGDRTVNFTVPARTVTELKAALEAANLAALPPLSGTQTPDARSHRLIYGGQAVRFFDGSMPQELGPPLAILGREMARGRQQR